jgi:hypothetical protein
MPRANYVAETSIIREIMASPECRIEYTRHALQRMKERDVLSVDIEEILTNGHVTLIETAQADITWRIEGRDIDGRNFKVVASVNEDLILIKIITVF